ncbi:DUF4397 domain-containing protein [Arachidicoccus sp.]|uniref:DUF4397 domain-containing protein n=1 Tax=Arachidicoccus sp. TaxID=1872624 RepID=UPI003D25C0A6
MKRKFSLDRITIIFIGLILVGGIFSSCLKDNYPNGVSVQVAGIALINASPGSPNLNFIADGQRKPLPSLFAYDSAMAYLPAYPGYRVFGFTLPDSYNLLISQQFYLEPGDAYSIFISDSLEDAKLTYLRDTAMLPDSSMAGIRFANFSPNSQGLDLIVANTDTLANNIVYTKATAFRSIAPSTNYSFQLKEKGSNTILATLNNVSIEKGKAYTLWARGFENSNMESTKIGLAIMRNR